MTWPQSNNEKERGREDLWTALTRNTWGWFDLTKDGRVRIPPQIREEFEEGIKFSWLVVKNREEALVAVQKGKFDHGKILLGEPNK